MILAQSPFSNIRSLASPEDERNLNSGARNLLTTGAVQRSVCAHEQARAPCWMHHRDEPHHPAGWAPQQVVDPILDDHLDLAVDGAFGLLERLGVLRQGAGLAPL